MKAAVTVWDGRVSPVFDVSREAMFVTIENGVITARSRQSIALPTASLRIDRLTAAGVQILICGAISKPCQCELAARGVTVLGFVSGELEDVVRAFMERSLPSSTFCMPGCCGQRLGPRRRRARSRGRGHNTGS